MLRDILKKFESLPEEKKRFLSSPMALAALEEIEKKYGVKLALILMEVAVDESKKSNLASFLENRLALPKDTSFQLARDLEEEIFREFGEIDENEKAIKEEFNDYSDGQNFNSGGIAAKEPVDSAKVNGGVNFKAENLAPPQNEQRVKEDVFFGEEDEKEIKNINGRVNDIKSGINSFVIDWDAEASGIINKLNIGVKNEILGNRLKNIIISSLKGVRNNISARETLMRKTDDGGMGFDFGRADNILQEIKNKKSEMESGPMGKEPKDVGFEFILGRENEPMIRKEKISPVENESGSIQSRPDFKDPSPRPTEWPENDAFNGVKNERMEAANNKAFESEIRPPKETISFEQGMAKPFNIFGNKKNENIANNNGNNVLAPPPPAIVGKKEGVIKNDLDKTDFVDYDQPHKVKASKPLIIEEKGPAGFSSDFFSGKDDRLKEPEGEVKPLFKDGVFQGADEGSLDVKKANEPEKKSEAVRVEAKQKTFIQKERTGDDSFAKKLEEIKNMPPGGRISNFSATKPKQEAVKENKSFASFIFNKKKSDSEAKKFSGGKVKMEDIRKVEPRSYPDLDEESKLVGPVEELGSISVDYFRELSSDPFRAAEKIEEKIKNLEEMSLENKVAGIKAWKRGEVNRMYLEILNMALIEHKSFSRIIAEKKEKKEQVLTEQEFDAVSELNKRLRF